MSALKRLEEIEGRLKAATPADKWLDPFAPHINVPRGECWGAMLMDEADTLLAKSAPADLAYLARLARMALEAECGFKPRDEARLCFNDDCDVCNLKRAAEEGR